MLVQLTQEPLEAEPLVRAVRTDASGAVTLFYGVVRNHNEGRGVLFLEYEAYPELAEKQLRAVGEEILQRFPIDDIAIAHRTGRALRCNSRDGTIVDDKAAMAMWTREYQKGWEPRV